jgi:hypothetical protein
MTVCRPFIVGSRSRQPPLSICNLLGVLPTACRKLRVTAETRLRSRPQRLPELGIQTDANEHPSMLDQSPSNSS